MIQKADELPKGWCEMIEDYFMRLVQVGIAQTGANPIEAMDAYDRASKVRIPMDVDPLDAARHFLQY